MLSKGKNHLLKEVTDKKVLSAFHPMPPLPQMVFSLSLKEEIYILRGAGQTDSQHTHPDQPETISILAGQLAHL